MTYEEFKQKADAVMSAKRKLETIASIKTGDIVNGKIVLDEKEAEGFKALLSTCICLSSIAKDNVFKFYDLLASTESDNKREKYGLKEEFCKDGSNRSMANRLLKLCREHDKALMDFSKSGDYDELIMMCDSIDRAEELLKPITDAYKRMMMWKITRKTLSTPLDPVLLNQMIISFVLMSITQTLYESFSHNFGVVLKYDKLKFLKMDRLMEQMNRLLLRLDFHDTKMMPLKTNINSLVCTKEARSIGDDILGIMLSIDFHSELLVVSNPELKVDSMPHVSLLPSMDKITLTIEEYKEKYDKLYRYDKAV